MKVDISKVRTDGGTQPRTEIDDTLVSEYAEAMRGGDQFPPITVFWDGVEYWLADGFHRLHAARRAGFSELDVDKRDGTRRDAILHSVGANAAHGQRRTNPDKRKAVMTLLDDEEWSQWSNVEVAKQCAVSEGLVRSLRTKRSEESGEPPPLRTYTTSDYSLFEIPEWHHMAGRERADGEGAKVLESMREHGFIESWPILVQRDGDKLLVRDGELRLSAAKELGIEVVYVVRDDLAPRIRTYTTRHGTKATMNTTNIGKRKPDETLPEAEDSPPDGGEQEQAPERPQSRGVGIRLAHEAIAVLKRIPYNDGLRDEAFDTVTNWIEANRIRA